MLEKVVENWLDKATERSFEKPFCYMLSAEGHTIIHPTKHNAMEMGKDIITIAPDGTPCAFQLKTGNISLSKWRNEIGPQINSLVQGKINHPSVDSSEHHRSYFVTNGNIAETVSREIDDANQTWMTLVHPDCYLKTIVRGQIFEKAKKLGIDLWPSELTDIKTLLEMFLESGAGVLPKKKLASLFESTIPLKLLDNGETPPKTHCARAIASTGLLCAIATSSFTNENNHVGEIEAWMLYIAYVLAVAERWKLPVKAYKNELEIAKDSIYNSLANLCDEIKERDELIEGDLLEDSYVYRIRLTWLLGLMSVYALWRRKDGISKNDVDNFLSDFCREKRPQLELWGEAAVPQFLAFFWYFRKTTGTTDPDFLLLDLISLICKYNGPNSKTFLANPYYEVEDILPHLLAPILGPSEDPLDDTFTGKSYALEGIVHLVVRRNWKQNMKIRWPGISRLNYISFKPENSWDFYRWENENGTRKDMSPKKTQEWEELKKLARDPGGDCIPLSIKDDPILLLLFLCVYPHRMNAEIMRWLDTQMKEIPRP